MLAQAVANRPNQGVSMFQPKGAYSQMKADRGDQ